MRRGVAILVTIAGVVSCARAAAVFLDLPPSPTPKPSAPSPVARLDTGPADTVRPAIEATLDPDSARRLLPKDGDGNVDWAAALRNGTIRPRAGLPDAAAAGASGFRFDFLYPGPAPVLDALFPHSTHVDWLACESCHPGVFRYRNAPPAMADIEEGRACGACHGKVAFPPSACSRCHIAMPRAGADEVDTTAEAPELLGTITLARGAAAQPGNAAFPPARFPHWVHRIRYRCAACHPALFQIRAGADTLLMSDMRRGQSCGRCHDGRAAFPLFTCSRCHVRSAAAPDSGS